MKVFKIKSDIQWRRRHDEVAVLCRDCAKQSEIANYNTKIEKLNSEILELNQVKSSISSLQGSFSECKNSGTSKLENTGAVQKINSKFTSKFYEGMHDLYNGAAFWNASSGLDKAIERVALEITRKQDEIAGCNQAIQDCNNRIAQLNAEIARIERAEQEAREAAAREAAAREAAARAASANTSNKK